MERTASKTPIGQFPKGSIKSSMVAQHEDFFSKQLSLSQREYSMASYPGYQQLVFRNH